MDDSEGVHKRLGQLGAFKAERSHQAGDPNKSKEENKARARDRVKNSKD